MLVKPDGVQRNLIGEIIGRYERIGLKLVGLKMLVPTPDLIERHYMNDEGWLAEVGKKKIENFKAKGLPLKTDDPVVVGRLVLERLKSFMTSGPVVAMIWEGAHAVAIVRKLVGGTEPLSSDVGTIRGDFVLDSYQMSDADERSIRNLVHASSAVAEADKEIAMWFRPEEILNYRLISEAILYDVNLDGILE